MQYIWIKVKLNVTYGTGRAGNSTEQARGEGRGNEGGCDKEAGKWRERIDGKSPRTATHFLAKKSQIIIRSVTWRGEEGGRNGTRYNTLLELG